MTGMAAEYGMAVLEGRIRALMRCLREDPASAVAITDELGAEIDRAASALQEALRGETV